jgi:site-specific DNA-cytosine methylase
MENVLVSRPAAGGETLREIEESFRSAGFAVETKALDASVFGVPQRLRRILLAVAR